MGRWAFEVHLFGVRVNVLIPGRGGTCCGCKAPPTCGNTKSGYKGPCSGAYTLTNFLLPEGSGPGENPRYPVTELANSVLVEWKNNNNNFFQRHSASARSPLSYCDGWLTNFDAAQDLTFANLSGPGHWNDFDSTSFPAPCAQG